MQRHIEAEHRFRRRRLKRLSASLSRGDPPPDLSGAEVREGIKKASEVLTTPRRREQLASVAGVSKRSARHHTKGALEARGQCDG